MAKKRTNEDILEFGADLFDDDDDYNIYCDANDSRNEFLVESLISSLVPAEGQYIHIDVEIPDVEEQSELHLIVKTNNGRNKKEAWFNQNNISLFRDGNRLHMAPFLTTELMGEGYTIGRRETDTLQIILQKDGEIIVEHQITIEGPWPLNGEESFEFDFQAADEVLKTINECSGLENFKARMNEVANRCKVGQMRADVGLKANPPVLHTAFIGNPGTGKTKALELMAKLYKSLGLIEREEITTEYVSGAETGINIAVSNARGGVLVIKGVDDLNSTQPKSPGLEQEGHIVNELVEALAEKSDFKKSVTILVGEPDGMEYLLSAHPDLKQHLADPIYFEDLKPEELFSVVDRCCSESNVKLSCEARQKLEMYILHKYNRRSPGFQNSLLVKSLFDDSIIPAMYNRLSGIPSPSKDQLELVMPEDIPTLGNSGGDAMAELDELIGMDTIKKKVKDYLEAIKLASRRMEMGLPTNMPRLHMAFLGNPGTGKTTVADIIGRVFASWGILSGGHVIHTEKSKLVGQYIGETELKMRKLLARARGNILFIDEAYQLVGEGERDFGHIVMDSLLTELGKDNVDMVVILAGYTAPMKKLLESNEGIESRFPNVFNFEDYTSDELLEIGKLMIRKQGFTMTDGAIENMRAIIREESDKPSPRFGNGRFMSNLIQNEIMATIGARTAKLANPTKEDLSTILPEDVVVDKSLKDAVFDDVAIDAALARLDSLAGLDGVKKAIHNFVQSARYLHSIGEPYVGKGLLSWRFIGNSGTGKSTVAEIMAGILRGMRLISNSHITQIKGERLFGASDYNCDEVLKEAVKKACNGLIFIDMDDPKFSDGYGRIIEQIRLKVKELTVEVGGECALILAELDAPNANLAEQLYDSGVYEFDHTLVFKDFTQDELFQILCQCLEKYGVSFSPDAEKHIRAYLKALCSSTGASARTMKLMSRAIYQQVILRESALPEPPKAHEVQLSDIATFKWDSRKGKIGF